MAIKVQKPTTSGQRGVMYEDFSIIDKKQPEKSLVTVLKKHSGRDKTGKISVRHQGGGEKRKFRIIGNLQRKMDVPAEVKFIEYDPNRSAFIALVLHEDGIKQYILAPANINKGDKIVGSSKTDIKVGNRMQLKNIPTGIQIYDIELIPGRGKGQIVRSAGSSAAILAAAEGSGKRAKYVQIKLPSGEIRLIHEECFASIGQVSNASHSLVKIGKAGRKRHMGIRPSVRGKVMSPRSHPHGGGEGVNPVGLKYPKTPWGKPALGYKTRRRKYSNKFIVKRVN
jgi:large subunit ribosomal protein L2